MNDLARQRLCELIEQHGAELSEDSRRCRALLKERCGELRAEIDALIDALREGVPLELRTAPAGAPAEAVSRLTKHLQDELDLPEADARWAVESWGLALKVLR